MPLFDYVGQLKYEQYALNDFFWTLDKQNKKEPLKKVEKAHIHDHGHGTHACSHAHSHHHHAEPHQHKVSNGCSHSHHHCQHDHHVEAFQAFQCQPCGEEPLPIPKPHHEHRGGCSHHHHGAGHQHGPSCSHNHGHHRHQPQRKRGGLSLCTAYSSGQHVPSVVAADAKCQTTAHLLKEFESLTVQRIAQDRSQRERQVHQQNTVVDKVVENSQEFILHSQTKDHARKQTTFVYLDPGDRENREKRVTYIRDDRTGKIDVRYGKDAEALIVERADMQNNSRITQCDQGAVQQFGHKERESMFQSFTVDRGLANVVDMAPYRQARTFQQHVHGSREVAKLAR